MEEKDGDGVPASVEEDRYKGLMLLDLMLLDSIEHRV
jgi:hypothetical protein